MSACWKAILCAAAVAAAVGGCASCAMFRGEGIAWWETASSATEAAP